MSICLSTQWPQKRSHLDDRLGKEMPQTTQVSQGFATEAAPYSLGRCILLQTPAFPAVMFHLLPLVPSLPYFLSLGIHQLFTPLQPSPCIACIHNP